MSTLFKLLLVMGLLAAATPGRADSPPITEPIPFLERLIEQGGVFPGWIAGHFTEDFEFRVERSAANKAWVYRLSATKWSDDRLRHVTLSGALTTPRGFYSSPVQEGQRPLVAELTLQPLHDGEPTYWEIHLYPNGRPYWIEARGRKERFQGLVEALLAP